MTPKEKALELVDKYDELLTYLESKSKAKKCALIAVEELIIEKNKWENGSFDTSSYWDYVKQEIDKL